MITLRAKLPSGRNEKVTINQESTLRDLTTLLASSFPELTNPESEQNITLLHGFPPKKINVESEDEPVSKFFRNMEPMIVQLQGGVSQAASSPPASESTPTSKVGSKRKPTVSKASDKGSSSTVKAPKLSFGANIHSISASSTAAGSKKTGKGKGKAASKATAPAKAPFKPTFGATTATLSARGGLNGRSKGTGGLCVSRSSRAGGRTSMVSSSKRKSRLNLSSQDDIGTSLLTAVTAGSGGSKKNKFLRGTFRRAVALEYEASQAQARVMSLLSGKYSIQESLTARTLGSTAGRSEAAQIIVQYHKGHGNRSFHFETVDLLTRAQLKAVVRLLLGPSSTPSATSSSDGTTTPSEEEEEEEGEGEGDEEVGRELLRARYMAKCSPRVFWSLVHHYGPSIPSALSQLLPELDWTWLVSDEEGVEGDGGGGGRRRRDGLGGGKDGDSVRRRQLSEKARENQRQARAAAAEAQEKKDMKRLLAVAKERKLDREKAGSNKEEKELVEDNEDEVVFISAAVAQQNKVAEVPLYRGPRMDVADDMLRVLLLTGCDERSADAGRHKFELIASALRAVFQINDSCSSSGSSSSSCSGRSYGRNFSADILHALADTSPPPLGGAADDGDEDDANEADLSGSLALLQSIQSQLQSQWQSQGLLPNESRIPYITLSHLSFWIRAARWMVVTHFWAVEVHRASEHVPQWAALLAAGGIKRVRDLSLWRHAPGDLITYLRDSQSRGREGTNNEFPSEVELGYMCQLSESFRDQCEWVDEWTDSDLESAHATVHRPSERTSKSESWYRSPSALPRYCYEVLPEAVLLELNPVTSACDKNSTESVAWQTLADLASYEEVLCLRQYVPPTMERVVRVVAASSFEKEDNSAEALPACLGRHVSFRMTDDGVVEAAAGGTGGGAVSEADILRGVVAAYVPPTDEETMALWKVLLHSGQWQDLELHELREALTEE